MSQLSQVISTGNLLEPTWQERKQRFCEGGVPLPAAWDGDRLQPLEFEFQQGSENRLPNRFRDRREPQDADGGISGWQGAGLPLRRARSAPLPLMRQVQIAAGSLVLLRMILSSVVTGPWILLSWFVGAGLLFSGLSSFCGMARLLSLMPWNRVQP